MSIFRQSIYLTICTYYGTSLCTYLSIHQFSEVISRLHTHMNVILFEWCILQVGLQSYTNRIYNRMPHFLKNQVWKPGNLQKRNLSIFRQSIYLMICTYYCTSLQIYLCAAIFRGCLTLTYTYECNSFQMVYSSGWSSAIYK